MPRRVAALVVAPVATLVAVGGLLAVSGVVTVAADAAVPSGRTVHHAVHHAGQHKGRVTVRAETRSPKRSSSVALLASANATFRIAAGVARAKPHRIARLTTPDSRSLATGISGDGDHALVCADSSRVYPVHSVRTKPRAGRPLDVSRFTDEGGKGFGFFCDGVSLHGRHALVTGDAQGVLQLVREHDGWKVDRRVRSPGVNEAGDHHRPGWIRFRRSVTSTTYEVVSIAPRGRHGGPPLAVAIDRADGTLAVIKGVGTAKPRNVGILTTPRLRSGAADSGTGGLAWQPGGHDRALVTTDNGFAVLDLRHPRRPRLERLTKVPGGIAPGTLSISSDGDHLAVAAGNKVFGYGHVRAAVGKGRRFALETGFRPGTRRKAVVRDAVYTAHDDLVVLHGVGHGRWFLTVVAKVARGHHVVMGSMPTTRPAGSGSVSVWPSPSQ